MENEYEKENENDQRRGMADGAGRAPCLRECGRAAKVRAMRWVSVALLSVLGAATAVAADVSFVRVWPQWHSAETFDRIGEYFGKPENDWGESIVRTHPDQRAGMYFLVRVKSGSALDGAKFVLQVIRPDAPEPKTFTFPVSLRAKSHIAELGLTDGDWPGGRDAHPVAWKLTLVDAAGHAVASEHSFLWAKPAP